MACVYVLRSESLKKNYVGSSHEDKAEIRLKIHNNGKVRSTKAGRPWEVIYFEKVSNYTQARQLENYLKTGQGREWLKNRRDGRVVECGGLENR